LHLPDARLARRGPAVGDVARGGVIGSLVVALELVGQGRAAVRRQVINRPRKRSPLSGPEVVHAADEGLAVVRSVVPDNLIGPGPPLQPTTLLPVPGGRRADPGPLVLVLQVDHADHGTISGSNVTLFESDSHAQE